MNITNIYEKGVEGLSYVGDNAGNLSTKAITFINEKVGDNFISKLIFLIVVIGVIYFATKITNKLLKFILIILFAVLGFSIVVSILK